MSNFQPENASRIQEILSGPPGLAAFDFDNTLIVGDLGEVAMSYIALQGLLRLDLPEFWKALHHRDLTAEDVLQVQSLYDAIIDDEADSQFLQMLDLLLTMYERIHEHSGLEEAYRWTKVFFAGRTQEELGKIGKYVWQSQLEESFHSAQITNTRSIPMGLRIRPYMRELIRELMQRNWQVKIVTASPEDVVRSALGAFALEKDAVHGMNFETDENHLLSFQLREPFPFGSGKSELVSRYDLPLRLAAGDSITDKELLLASENAIFFDKKSHPQMVELAKEKNWMIEPVDSPWAK